MLVLLVSMCFLVFNIVSTVLLTFLQFLFAAGVTGVLPTEVFDQMSRPAAYMICGSLLWFNLFLVGTAFPFIVVGSQGKAITCTSSVQERGSDSDHEKRQGLEYCKLQTDS